MNNYAGHPIMYATVLSTGQGARHMSGDFLFTYAAEGSCRISADGQEYTVASGEGVLFAPSRRIVLENRGKDVFSAIHIQLSEYAIEDYLFHNPAPCHTEDNDMRPVHLFKPHILLHCLSDGIQAAIAQGYKANQVLTFLKIQECIQILVNLRPPLHRWFSLMCHARKIDLRLFMEQNYVRNIPLEHFAQACGRSLSTFRREFLATFGMQPGKWLLARRLDEAYRRIATLGERPSEFLGELGFESFSHFTRTFKERFGKLPSQIRSGNEG